MNDFPSEFNVGSATPVHDMSDRPPLSIEKLRQHARNLREIEGGVPFSAYVYGDSLALRVDIAGDDREECEARLDQVLPPLATLGADRILLVGTATVRNSKGVIVCESRRDGTLIYAAEDSSDNTLGEWGAPDTESKESLTKFFGSVWAQVPE